MRDDFDSVVADRFKVLDQVPVPDTWSRIQRSRQAGPGPTTAKEVLTMIDLETPVPNEPRRRAGCGSWSPPSWPPPPWSRSPSW